MMWATYCLAFFGFLRSSKFMIPSQDTYDSEVHLSLKDIAIDVKFNPQLLHVSIKQSKTRSFTVPRTNQLPHLPNISHHSIRGNQHGPLFLLKDGRRLTRQLFSTFLDNILGKLQLNQSHFGTHSFQIGAATTAKEAGVDDICIKMLGCCISDTYQQYIRKLREQLTKLSKALVKTLQHVTLACNSVFLLIVASNTVLFYIL